MNNEKHSPIDKQPEPVKDEGMNNWTKAVLDWHRKFGVDVGNKPEQIQLTRFEMRQNILQEEVNELNAAYYSGELHSVADAICDVLYVVIGTAIEFGLHDRLDTLFNEVHRSNMSKLDENGKPVKRADGKILKSKLFSPPNLSIILSSPPEPDSKDQQNDAVVSKEEYDHAINKIGQLQEQLKEAEREIRDLEKGYDH